MTQPGEVVHFPESPEAFSPDLDIPVLGTTVPERKLILVHSMIEASVVEPALAEPLSALSDATAPIPPFKRYTPTPTYQHSAEAAAHSREDIILYEKKRRARLDGMVPDPTASAYYTAPGLSATDPQYFQGNRYHY
jgi:hypothetical protein